MKLNQKNWSCSKKQKARWETIISQYRLAFKHALPPDRLAFKHALPPDRQYWTLCGQCATPEGKQLQGSEVWQVIDQGLIRPEQFHGVELNPEIHELNVLAFPDLNWHNDDFYRAMVLAISKDEFNPAIVNADLPRTPDGGVSYISKIMALLTDTAKDVMLVANLILRTRCYTAKDGNYVIDMMNKSPQFRYAVADGKWTLLPQYYEYDGAGDTGSRTWMGSFIFLKK